MVWLEKNMIRSWRENGVSWIRNSEYKWKFCYRKGPRQEVRADSRDGFRPEIWVWMIKDRSIIFKSDFKNSK